jgi:uncharacterized membrane protein YcaP (DUF421 family)
MLSDLAEAGAVQTALRTVMVYALTLAIVRLGSKRVMGKGTAMDMVVAIMLGSIMSDGIDGKVPLLLVVVAGGVLFGMHWVLALVTFRTNWLGPIVKGNRVLLIKQGSIQEEGMRQGNVTRNDLTQAIREKTKYTDPSQIRLAYLERDGQISVVPEKGELRVIDVSVEKGVQTVRIELE